MTAGASTGPAAPAASDAPEARRSALDEFLAELESMVNVDCGTYTPDGVNTSPT